MSQFLLRLGVVGIVCASFMLYGIAAPGMRAVADTDAASLCGGGPCQFTVVPGLHCGNAKIQPVACVDIPGAGTTDGGSSRRGKKYCTNNGTDVCGTVYNNWDCGTSP